MSTTLEANTRQGGSDTSASVKKQFGKGEREIPHHSQKAKKWYPVEDEVKPKKVSEILKQMNWSISSCQMDSFRASGYLNA